MGSEMCIRDRSNALARTHRRCPSETERTLRSGVRAPAHHANVPSRIFRRRSGPACVKRGDWEARLNHLIARCTNERHDHPVSFGAGFPLPSSTRTIWRPASWTRLGNADHVIAATKAQVENIPDLDDETAGALLRTAARIARTIEAAFHPDGITMMPVSYTHLTLPTIYSV